MAQLMTPEAAQKIKALRALMHICGGKASGWLSGLDGTEQAADAVRRMVLLDYQYNTHSEEGIDNLTLVLKYISNSIQ